MKCIRRIAVRLTGLLFQRHRGIVCGLTLVLSSLAVPSGAQENTLEALIGTLQNLQESGALDGSGLLGNPGDSLERLRSDAEERATKEAEDGDPNVVQLSPSLELFVRRFCRGETHAADDDIVRLIRQFSAIERDYCKRAGTYLTQLGYEVFQGVFGNDVLSIGAISPDFVLGVGDELVVTFIGSDSRTLDVAVDREGNVVIPELPPIPAAGRRLDAFKDELAARAQEAFLRADVFVSLGAVRSLSVMVLGEVERPGLQRLTALSSIVDAIGVAGGIRKTGSLRNVSVRRGTQTIRLDIYDLIFGRAAIADFRVQEGDQIVVPTIGATLAVTGDVRKPVIAEVDPNQPTATIVDALTFAGGPLRPRGNRYYVATFDTEGREQVREVDPTTALLSDGDLLTVVRGRDIAVGGVSLVGHVRVEGRRALVTSPTIGALLGGRDSLKDRPYLPFGVLVTRDPRASSDRMLAVDLGRILDNTEDYSLIEGDRLIVLGREDVAYLGRREVQEIVGQVLVPFDAELPDSTGSGQGAGGASDSGVAEAAALERLSSASIGVERLREELLGQEGPATATLASRVGAPSPRCRSLDDLDKLVSEVRPARFSGALVFSNQRSPRSTEQRTDECRPIYEEVPGLLPFVLEHVLSVDGEVRRPGIYPVAAPVTLASLVGVAGGLTREADLTRTELRTFDTAQGNNGTQLVDLSNGALSNVAVHSGSVVRFNPLLSDRESGTVELIGEFVHPGAFDIRRGERLSQLMARAGGLTVQAYPFGAIFTRERVRVAEEVALRKLARDLSSAVAVAAANRGIDGSSINTFAQLTRDLSQTPATGRVVIEADPTVLQVRPELDVVLQPGDKIFMPKRPNSVLVTGDVLNPGAMQFRTGKNVEGYIRQAGGFQRSADQNRVFVVFPNGAAQPVSTSAFNFTSVQIPPGSTIVVPKDATPFNLFTVTREVASVVSQLAITAASLAVIGDN